MERHPSGECRCLCGQLLARWIPGGIELKCKRCRRIVTLPLGRTESVPQRVVL
jgi:phage FluMu protein Com